MWYDRGTDYAIVEPVATDPTGVGEDLTGGGARGIRRCGRWAKVAYVGSDSNSVCDRFHSLAGESLVDKN